MNENYQEEELHVAVYENRRIEALKAFSTIGFAIFAIVVTMVLAQSALMFTVMKFFGEEYLQSSAVSYANFGLLYLLAIPIGVAILYKLPAVKIVKNNLSIKEMFCFLLVSFSFMYVGNLLSTGIISIISSILGQSIINPVSDFLMGNSLSLRILVVVILAPIVEEYLCRKLIIDRIVQYGEWVAIFTSAILFGLFHQNLFQFFYAFLLGLVFGYVYVKTGKIIYTIVLHAVINFFGGVVSVFFLGLVDVEQLAGGNLDGMTQKDILGLLIFASYILVIFLAVIVGLILFFTNRKKITLNEGSEPLKKEEWYRIIFFNPGMIVIVITCVTITILSLFMVA